MSATSATRIPSRYSRLLLLLLFMVIIVILYTQFKRPGPGLQQALHGGETNVAPRESVSPNTSGEFRSGGRRPMPQPSTAASSPEALREMLAEARTSAEARLRKDRELIEEQFRQEFYGPRLAQLGLSPEQSERVLQELTAIRNEAVVAGDAMLALQMQRAQHDKRMKDLLGEEGYERYRKLEAEKNYVQQLNNEILPFARERNVEIGESERQALVSLMAKHGLSTYVTWDGPYEPMPSPGLGVEAAIQMSERKLERLGGLEAFVSDAKGALPMNVVEAVESFFRNEYEAAQSSVAYWNLRPEERQALDIQRSVERRRSRPGAP